jgi:hypothetical protein
MKHVWRIWGMPTAFMKNNLRARGHSKILGVDGKIYVILK